jgi:anti-sigma regulatory factor (Ser/Thr protein kinase)
MASPVTSASAGRSRDPTEGFRHEAFLYSGLDEFLHGMLPFIREGVERQEPVLVVIGADKIELLRAELGLNGGSDEVLFADMEAVGRNPARIIPAWRDFVGARPDPGRPVRGIGEPIYPERSQDELAECHRHESLLNLAFADTPGFWLMCPYDVDALDAAVIEGARRNHPLIRRDGSASKSEGYEQAPVVFQEPLPEPVGEPHELAFDAGTLAALRAFLQRFALDAGMSPTKAGDFLLASNEAASNSIRHGGGAGLLRVWEDGDTLISEVRDSGVIDTPLAGRERPTPGKPGGRGLWLANQLCELVQLRSFPNGNVVRLHMRRS